ncbi:hypothetical protein BG74_06370 [Sodalis-like endosymbiont of Proechinophthirus fluctus]|nr:hypothetical protein BG74_06370 [Sodalis-like endosymbiont of Proechinophthirus fluctus]
MRRAGNVQGDIQVGVAPRYSTERVVAMIELTLKVDVGRGVVKNYLTIRGILGFIILLLSLCYNVIIMASGKT